MLDRLNECSPSRRCYADVKLAPIEIIRLQQYLLSKKNLTNKLPEQWVKSLRMQFERRLATSQLGRSIIGEIIEVNGFFWLIEPGSYRDGDIEQQWQSFLLGAITQTLIINGVCVEA